jgi:hypothetical protein
MGHEPALCGRPSEWSHHSEPGLNDTFGIKGLKSKAHQIVIPARPFLRLSEYWLEAIRTKVLTEYAKAIKALLRGDQ